MTRHPLGTLPAMKKLRSIAIVVALVSISSIAASNASAATEVGSNCGANTGVGGYTLVQLAQTGSALPLTAPAAGVATKWKVNLDPAVKIPPGISISERMRVLRSTGTPNQFQTIAESSPGNVVLGPNVFDTRIPVQAGDHFGAFAPEGEFSAVLFCSTESEANVIGANKADIGPGSTADYEPVPKLQLALSVTIEPDADHDGYGTRPRTNARRALPLRRPARSSSWTRSHSLPARER